MNTVIMNFRPTNMWILLQKKTKNEKKAKMTCASRTELRSGRRTSLLLRRRRRSLQRRKSRSAWPRLPHVYIVGSQRISHTSIRLTHTSTQTQKRRRRSIQINKRKSPLRNELFFVSLFHLSDLRSAAGFSMIDLMVQVFVSLSCKMCICYLIIRSCSGESRDLSVSNCLNVILVCAWCLSRLKYYSQM